MFVPLRPLVNRIGFRGGDSASAERCRVFLLGNEPLAAAGPRPNAPILIFVDATISATIMGAS